MKNFIGKKVIVRGDRSGVFFGTLAERHGQEVLLKSVRKLYYWDGAAAVEQLARDGVSRQNNCKFTVVVDSIIVTDAIQILPCTNKAIESLEGVREWRV